MKMALKSVKIVLLITFALSGRNLFAMQTTLKETVTSPVFTGGVAAVLLSCYSYVFHEKFVVHEKKIQVIDSQCDPVRNLLVNQLYPELKRIHHHEKAEYCKNAYKKEYDDLQHARKLLEQKNAAVDTANKDLTVARKLHSQAIKDLDMLPAMQQQLDDVKRTLNSKVNAVTLNQRLKEKKEAKKAGNRYSTSLLKLTKAQESKQPQDVSTLVSSVNDNMQQLTWFQDQIQRLKNGPEQQERLIEVRKQMFARAVAVCDSTRIDANKVESDWKNLVSQAKVAIQHMPTTRALKENIQEVEGALHELHGLAQEHKRQSVISRANRNVIGTLGLCAFTYSILAAFKVL